MREVADNMFLADEVLGTAWYGKSKDDDAPVTLPDGSDHVSYNPKTKQLITWNEREGKKPAALRRGEGYVVQFEQNKAAVPPYTPYAMVSVVFPAQPTEKRAYDAVIAEAIKAVQQTHSSMSVTVFAMAGKEQDPASLKQVRGSNGKYISAEFDPKRPGKLFGADGRDLGVQVK